MKKKVHVESSMINASQINTPIRVRKNWNWKWKSGMSTIGDCWSTSVGKEPDHQSNPIVPGSNPTDGNPPVPSPLSEAESWNNGTKNMSKMRKRISLPFHTEGWVQDERGSPTCDELSRQFSIKLVNSIITIIIPVRFQRKTPTCHVDVIYYNNSKTYTIYYWHWNLSI